MKNDNIILDKSMDLAVRIVRLYQYLGGDKREYVLSKQVLKSGTSIGANIKEASETGYWPELLYKTEYISEKQFCSINEDRIEIIRILTSIIKNTKEG
ncbi:four helix bundle protein [Ruminococcus sp.]|uniref:four helix bundle protein n=1 Tax=Ruminococcus sp. TaxID=41978 RepID=UPI0034373694